MGEGDGVRLATLVVEGFGVGLVVGVGDDFGEADCEDVVEAVGDGDDFDDDFAEALALGEAEESAAGELGDALADDEGDGEAETEGDGDAEAVDRGLTVVSEGTCRNWIELIATSPLVEPCGSG